MQRLWFLIRLYATFVAVFIIQKPCFMLFNHQFAEHLSLSDFIDVVWAGLPLDLSISAYVTVLPLCLAFLLSLFSSRTSLRALLTPYYAVVALAVTLIFVADMVIYHSIGVKIDATELMYLSNPKDIVASLAPWQTVLALVVVGGLTCGFTLALCTITPRRMQHYNAWSALMALPLLGLLFLAVRGGVSKSTANISYAYFSPVPFLNHSAVNPVFNMFHSIGKYQSLSDEFRFYADDESTDEWQPAFTPDTTVVQPLLRTTRPDILLIIWEGCGSHFADDSLVTPCFNRLKRHGTYFTQFYANSYRTDRGVLSLLSGWQSLPTLSLMKRTDLCRRLPSISQTLAGKGYTSTMYYGGDIDFTNMRCYLNETGFANIVSYENITAAAPANAWGYHDEWLCGIDCINGTNQKAQNGHRQMSVVLTLSSHEPWTVPMQKFSDERANSFAYTDRCIGEFIEKIKRTDRWNNLLVIITADHGINWYEGQPASDIHIPHIPMLWLGGALRDDAPRTVDVIGSQSDLAATLLAQMHLPFDNFPLSRNLFASTYTAPFAFNASKGGIHLIDTLGVSTYDHATDRETRKLVKGDTTRLHRTRSLLQYVYDVTARMERGK